MKSFIKDKNNPILLLLLLIGIFAVDIAVFSSTAYSGGRIFAILIVALAIFLNVEHTYYLTIFSFPFASVLKLSDSTISIIPIIYAIIIVKLAIMKRQKLKTVPLFAFILFAIAQFLCVIFYDASMTSVISFLLSAFFVLYSASFFASESNRDKNMLKNAALFLAVSVALNILLSDLFPNAMSFISAGNQEALESHNRFGALLVEPNELSQIILVAVGFLIATFTLYKKIIAKIGIIALILYLVSNGIRTNSKSYVLTLFGMLCILMLLAVIRFVRKKHSMWAIFGIGALMMVGVIAGYYLIYNVVIPVFEFRGDNGADLLTGRNDIWQMYIDAIINRFDVVVTGCGAGNVAGVLKLVGVNVVKATHNTYIEYLIQFGIIGLVLLMLSWFEALKNAFRKPILFWIPALAFLITAFGISANANDCIFITIAILSMSMITNPLHLNGIEK